MESLRDTCLIRKGTQAHIQSVEGNLVAGAGVHQILMCRLLEIALHCFHLFHMCEPSREGL